MTPPIDRRESSGRSPSRGRCFLYVLPWTYQDLLKLGFSRDPLALLQALHPRYFEPFDLDLALPVEAETVRDALDACAALGIDLEPLLPGAVLRWHRAVAGAHA